MLRLDLNKPNISFGILYIKSNPVKSDKNDNLTDLLQEKSMFNNLNKKLKNDTFEKHLNN